MWNYQSQGLDQRFESTGQWDTKLEEMRMEIIQTKL